MNSNSSMKIEFTQVRLEFVRATSNSKQSRAASREVHGCVTGAPLCVNRLENFSTSRSSALRDIYLSENISGYLCIKIDQIGISEIFQHQIQLKFRTEAREDGSVWARQPTSCELATGRSARQSSLDRSALLSSHPASIFIYPPPPCVK